jgi:hypothetical protein
MIKSDFCVSFLLQVEVCIKRLRMDAPELAAALNRIDTDKLKVRVTGPWVSSDRTMDGQQRLFHAAATA